MFCFQCEQTRDVKGCTTVGVCGKTPDVAALQDLLVYADKGISMYAKKLREMVVIALYPSYPSASLINENFRTLRITKSTSSF
jgi:hydroxylamine reductase (hybrid-cluster protein)